jgi:uncharacterized protein (DUF2147 family)
MTQRIRSQLLFNQDQPHHSHSVCPELFEQGSSAGMGGWRRELICTLLLVIHSPAYASGAAELTAGGIWEKLDDAGKPEGWFRIAERNGVYEGQIVRMFPAPGQDPSNWRCTKCEGDQKNAPVLGITFISGMKRKGLAYEDGKILDPRDGSIYSARMDLSADGQKLSVRGYLGISLLGQTQVWQRVPADALAPEKAAQPPPQRSRSKAPGVETKTPTMRP